MKRSFLLFLLLAMFGSATAPAENTPGTPSGSYITVLGTSGSLAHSITASLKVR